MKIRCTNCKKNVYELTERINQWEVPKPEHFRGISGFSAPKYGEEMRCPNCWSQVGIINGIRNAIKRLRIKRLARKNKRGVL